MAMAMSIHNGLHESFCFSSFLYGTLCYGTERFGALVPRRLACTGIKMRGVTESYKICVFATIPDLL